MITSSPAVGETLAGVDVWRAPLVPVALAATAGIVVDRYAAIPLPVSLIVLVGCLAAWAINLGGRGQGLLVAYLLGAVAGLGAAYHHWYRDVFAADDIGNFASEDARPAKLRGLVVEEPFIAWQPRGDPLYSMPRADPTFAVLHVSAYQGLDDWLPASGRVRLVLEGHAQIFHVGDEVEVTGRLTLPHGPANPGENNPAALLRDQRIRAVLSVRRTTDAVAVLASGGPAAINGWLPALRGWGQRRLEEALPAQQSSLAMAMLLGEGSTMTGADWDKYKRTGVVHILVVSGQQLVILAAFVWFVLRWVTVPRRRAAVIVALLMCGYAFLTGGRPPVMRAAVMVGVVSLGMLLRRTSLPANSFALAWLVVAGLSPTDMFTPGCQLSFLAVGLLIFGVGRWFSVRPDAQEQLADEDQPFAVRCLRGLLRRIAVTYCITLALWLATMPLVAAQYHMVTPIGLIIGPPVILLMTIALIVGFMLLLAAAIMPILVPPLAWITGMCVGGCDRLVTWCDGLPGAHFYVPDIPAWWLWVAYPALLAVVMLRPLQMRWRWAVPAGLAWLCVGLLGGSARPASDELRCTFLSVGHGGCTVIETPDGRTLLYDAGAMTGPEVTARHIAPFLWSRGIRRIDEVLISHADMDHFNGLRDLLDRFTVGQISCTPTFADRNSPGVREILAAIERCRVPVRIVRAGDRLSAGPVDMEVLHPPEQGPEGKENHRSLVLRVRHRAHTLLLTGDLEGPGLAMVLEMPAPAVDVLMAPHHGSKTSNTPALADWARPRVVISCEGAPRGPQRPPEPFTPAGAIFLGTWPHGAVTVRSGPEGLLVETFQSKQRFEFRD
jgi:competence protein ComEC